MFTIRIWDLPTRLFHWALAACVIGLVLTAQLGGSAMLWHFRLGYVVFTLLVFRLVWGFVGGRWSRWSALPLGLQQVRTYLQGRSSTEHLGGHNPLGSWSVLALLFFLSLQVATGLVSDDEISNTGPLSSLVSAHVASLATSWHKHWGKLTLIALVMSHLAAIAWYRWRHHQRLVSAMLHGDKQLDQPVAPSQDHARNRTWGAIVMLLSIALVAYVISLGS